MKHVFFGKSSRPCKVVLGKKRIGGFTPLTARSYVQDGLIGIWDGVENAGWGIHDATHSGMDNLAGTTCNLNVISNGAIGNNCFYSLGENKATISNSDKSNAIMNMLFSAKEYTFEIVGSGFVLYNNVSEYIVTGVTGHNFMIYRNSAYGLGSILVDSAYFFQPNSWIGGDKSLGNGFATHSRTGTLSMYANYVNGSVAQQSSSKGVDFRYSSSGYTNNRPMQYETCGKIFSIRVYNRALTADEIAANYAVDKARFNLP